MKSLKYCFCTILETLLRMLPFPRKTGLIKIGEPDRNAPVFVTCNFHLTVERVKHALKGMDCYLLVANSKGINVWCASTGGHFRAHSIISVLKISGIDKLVDHRKVVLPQLAAAGVEGREISEKTGWHVIWGPVYASDIPAFVANHFKKSEEMRQVRFPAAARLEMAVAWAFPISLIAGLIIYFVWRAALWPLVGLIWGLSLLIFLAFPLYESRLSTQKKRIGFIFFDFGRGGIQLILWGMFLIALVAGSLATGTFTCLLLLRWGLASLAIILLLSMDLAGSTPTLKSGLHPDRLLEVVIDESRCKGAAFCELVCPRDCYRVDRREHKARFLHKNQCVRCAACIIQCPFDALAFQDRQGHVLSAPEIRMLSLNLMGARKVVTR